MKACRRFILFFCAILVLSGCMSSSGFAPQSITNKKMSIYTTKLGGSKKLFLYHDVIYTYSEDNTYQATYQGEVVDSGDYSYKVTGPNKAKLVLTYTYRQNTYYYISEFYFDSPTSGRWIANESNDPLLVSEEIGTFKILGN